jgi:adenylate cyclase
MAEKKEMKAGSNENLFQFLERLIATSEDPTQHENEIWRRYGQNVAVLVLDSSGFSRISKSHGIIYFLAKLMQVRECVKPVFDTHNCIHMHFESDSVFAVFKHVDSAICCASDVHQLIRDSNIMLTEDERFSVCIGIGYGHMLYSETMEGYFSEEMNLASKLGEDTAAPNETLLSVGSYSSASESLRIGFAPKTIQISGLDISYFHKTHGQ